MTNERHTPEEHRDAEEREPKLDREEIKDLAPPEEDAEAVRGGVLDPDPGHPTDAGCE